METVTLEKVNNNILALKKELDEIKAYLEEDQLELSDDVKKEIKEARKKVERGEFYTEEEAKKKLGL